jgi:hypothetical protein
VSLRRYCRYNSYIVRRIGASSGLDHELAILPLVAKRRLAVDGLAELGADEDGSLLTVGNLLAPALGLRG